MKLIRAALATAIAVQMLAPVHARPADLSPRVSCDLPCTNVPCGAECWEVLIHYRRGGVTLTAADDQLWGSISGAGCRADYIADHGFWIEEWEHPTKIPASMIELVVIGRGVAVAESAGK